MDAKTEDLEKMNGEVDEVRWLTVAEASEILDYPDEVLLIQSGPTKRKKGT